MLRIIIIDDEQQYRAIMKKKLEELVDEVEVIGEASSSDEGMKLIKELKPNLVILDIQMPGKTGLEMIRDIEEINFQVIFSTAHDKYALEAIRLSACDYLLKPVEDAELISAIARARENLIKEDPNENLKAFSENLLNSSKEENKIALPTTHGTRFIKLKDILRCEADGSYTVVVLKDGEKIVVSKILKHIEEIITSYSFYRVHQTHLINIEEIQEYVRLDGGYLVMSDQSKIPIAKRKKDDFLRVLGL